MGNKKILIDALKNLNKAKAPAKKADTDYVSKMGYRDDSPFKKRKSININTPTGKIDMSNTGTPLIANGKYLPPYSGMHQFNTTEVTEVPLEEAKKGGSKKYSKSILATNKVFKKNPLFKKPKKSKLFKKTNYKGKTYDPAAMYFQDGGETVCDDRGCYETDQIQEYLDLGRDLPQRNVGLMWDVADEVNEMDGAYLGNAKAAWKSKGLPQTLGQRLGMTNPSNCMWAAGSGWQCLDETRDEFKNYPLSAFESNDKFISAVNKGTVPFTRIAKTNERNFDAQDKGLLQPGDIINIKGKGSSHAMTFSHYREDGKPIYLDSNGDVMDFDFNAGIWEGMKPGGNRYAYVSRFNPEMFYEDEIAALEEKARNNPTYEPIAVDRLPIRPIEEIPVDQSSRELKPRTWKYGIPYENNVDNTEMATQSSYKKGGSYVELELTEDEIKKYVSGGYVVEEVNDPSIPRLTRAQEGGVPMAPVVECPEGQVYDEQLEACIPVEDAALPEEQREMNYWYRNRTIEFPEGEEKYKKEMMQILPAYNPESPILPQMTTFPQYVDMEADEVTTDTPGGFPAAGIYDTSGKETVIKLNPALTEEQQADVKRHELSNYYMEEARDVNNALNDYWVEKNIIPFDKKWPKEKQEFYDYVMDSDEQNIQSYLNVARNRFNLKPTEVITEEKLDQMKKEAEEKGWTEYGGENFVPDIYLLFKMAKDNKGLLEWFNYIAKNDQGQPGDVQYAKFGGTKNYDLGDEVDEATKRKLEKLGYTFEKL